MATNANWTVVMDDKMIIKQSEQKLVTLLMMIILFGMILNFQIYGQFISMALLILLMK